MTHRHVLVSVLLMLWAAYAAGSSISGARDGVAIQGYDTVAYHTQKAAVKGSPKHMHEWGGTAWFFASDENRALFAQNPEEYVPKYGGHCALSVANGGTSRGAGEAWRFHNGRLYLNGSLAVQERWMRNVARNIYWADRNWPELKARLEAQ